MIYLSRKSTAFLALALEQAKSKKDKIYSFGRNNQNNLKLKFISEDSLQTKFCIMLPNDSFSISITCQQGFMIPYKYIDNEHLSGKELFSIEEINLLKGVKPVSLFHSVMLSFVDAMVNSLINYTEKSDKYKNEFREDSFSTIKFIFLLFMTQTPKFLSWGVEYAFLQSESVTIKVNGYHFVGLVQIKSNRGTDLFDITYLQEKTLMLQGGRKGLYLNDLINVIDKQIEYISDYQD